MKSGSAEETKEGSSLSFSVRLVYTFRIVSAVTNKRGICSSAFTFSLSMASSLPGLNMMRSCRLAMEPARLDRADRDGEGLIPVMALVTVERSSL